MPKLLDDEMSAAADGVRLAHFLRLEACGVPRTSIAQLGVDRTAFGVTRIRTDGSARFIPDSQGETAVIIPVIEPDRELGITGIIDLIAFRTCRPNEIYRRTGDGFALGLELLRGDEPVRLAINPIDWLSQAGRALLILDWGASSHFWEDLWHGPDLIVPSAAARRRLTRALRMSMSLPAIQVACGA